MIYFVTWRTVDSMPRERVEQWQRERQLWLDAHPEPRNDAAQREYTEQFSRRWERWLDEGHGACHLARPEIRGMVEEVIRNRDGADYTLDAFVVMPNHVHVLVCPTPGQNLSDIVQAWKSVSSHRINDALGLSGAFWQKESYDHIVRGPEQLERLRRYIAENPLVVKEKQRPQAWLRGGGAAGTGLSGGGAASTLLREEVTEEDIAKVVAAWTGIPVSRLQEGERSKLAHMEERLSQRVIGQKTAIKAVSNAVRRARAGLQDENRPIGSFLFLGPTGVGKTELSKALAELVPQSLDVAAGCRRRAGMSAVRSPPSASRSKASLMTSLNSLATPS